MRHSAFIGAVVPALIMVCSSCTTAGNAPAVAPILSTGGVGGVVPGAGAAPADTAVGTTVDKSVDKSTETTTLQQAFDAAVKGKGLSSVRGHDPVDGNYILIIASVPKSDTEPLAQQQTVLRLRAMQDMAAYLNVSISADESSTMESARDSAKGSASRDEFRSSISSSVRQTLSGVRQLGMAENRGRLYCGVYLAETELRSIAAAGTAGTVPATSGINTGPVVAVPSNDGWVIATGICAITNDRLDEAKKQALLQAQRNAVEQVLGVLIAGTDQYRTESLQRERTRSDGVTEKASRSMSHVISKIFSNTTGFIDRYTVLCEGVKGNCYEITIRAQVTRKKLLDNYQSLLKMQGDPEFYLDAGDDVELQQKMDEFFTGLGFRVTTARDRAAYIVTVTWKFAPVVHPVDKTQGVRLSVWVKLVAPNKLVGPNTEQVLFTVANDPRLAASFTGDATMQHDVVVRKAFDNIQKPLHEKINAVIAAMTQDGRCVTVLFRGYTPAKVVDAETAAAVLRDIPGVADVTTRLDADSGMIELRVTYPGRVSDLKDFLLKGLGVHPLSGGVPAVLQMTDNGLVLQL